MQWHVADGMPDTAVFVTRGAGNGRIAGGRFGPDAIVYAFTQNDQAAGKWLQVLARHAGCKVLDVATPAPHKDANDWTRAGADKAQIEAAMMAAKPVNKAVTADVRDFGRVTVELRGDIIGILADKQATATERGREIALLVVSALSQVGRLYFHAERRDFDSAMFFDAHRKRLERIPL